MSAPGTSLEFAFDLGELQALPSSYSIECSSRRIGAFSQTFFASSALRYLPPNPFNGSTVKLDRRTGGLLVREADDWEPFLPTGFYTVFSNYAETTDLIDKMAQQGCGLKTAFFIQGPLPLLTSSLRALQLQHRSHYTARRSCRALS